MVRLVHLTSQEDAVRMRRHGIRVRKAPGLVEGADRFVWTFPVLESYTLTHQWGRELKRWGRHTLAAVHLLIGDDEKVFAGHFNRSPLAMTAAQAVDAIRRAEDPRGYEIMIPRPIRPSEITSVRTLPKAMGWRYWPQAKSSDRWPCDCPVCLPRGEVKARRYRERVPLLQQRFEARSQSVTRSS